MSSVPGLPIEIYYGATDANSKSGAFIHVECSKGEFITWDNGIIEKLPGYIRVTEPNIKIYWSPLKEGEEIASEPIVVIFEVYLGDLMEGESCVAGNIIVDQDGLYTLAITEECQVVSNNEMDLPADLSEEKIHELYTDAATMYFWFDVSTLNVNMDKSVEVDGISYGLVKGEWSDYDHLKSVLLLTFDKVVAERLLSSSLYKNINGMLYSTPADRGTDIYAGEEIHKIRMISTSEIVYEVYVEQLGDDDVMVGYNQHNFVLKRYEDGLWRFKDFHMVR